MHNRDRICQLPSKLACQWSTQAIQWSTQAIEYRLLGLISLPIPNAEEAGFVMRCQYLRVIKFASVKIRKLSEARPKLRVQSGSQT